MGPRRSLKDEWPSLALCAFTALVAAVTVVKVQPAFAQMYADFGYQPEPLQRLALSQWFPSALAVASAATIAVRMISSRPWLRAAAMLLILALALAMPLLLLAAMRMPLQLIAATAC